MPDRTPERTMSEKKPVRKEMLINMLQPEECRIAIVENGILEELYVERSSQESYVGNIYKGKIVNIEPSIQAAFVDFGVGRNGFLHVSDVDPQYYRRRPGVQGDGIFDLLDLPDPPEDEIDWEELERGLEDEEQQPEGAELEEPYAADEPESADAYEGETAPPPDEDQYGADLSAGEAGAYEPQGEGYEARAGGRESAREGGGYRDRDGYEQPVERGPVERGPGERGPVERGPRGDRSGDHGDRGGRGGRRRGGRGRGRRGGRDDRRDDRRDRPQGEGYPREGGYSNRDRGPRDGGFGEAPEGGFGDQGEAQPPYPAEGELPPDISFTDEGEAPVVEAPRPDLGPAEDWEPTPRRPRPGRRERAPHMPSAEQRTEAPPGEAPPQESGIDEGAGAPPAFEVIEPAKPDFSGFGSSIFGEEAPPANAEPPRAESRRSAAEAPPDVAPPPPRLSPEPREERRGGFGASVLGEESPEGTFRTQTDNQPPRESRPDEPSFEQPFDEAREQQPRRPHGRGGRGGRGRGRHEDRRDDRREPRGERGRGGHDRGFGGPQAEGGFAEEQPPVERVEAERLEQPFTEDPTFGQDAGFQDAGFGPEADYGNEATPEEGDEQPPGDLFNQEYGEAPPEGEGEEADEFGPRDTGPQQQGDYYAPPQERQPAERGRWRGDRRGGRGGDRRGPRGDRGDRGFGNRGERGYRDRGGHGDRGGYGDRGRGGHGDRDRGRGGPRRGGRPPLRQKPPIQEIFRRGQEVLVQVIKEGLGTKGPTLSTYISIPGRYLVLMPGLHRIGVSRKIVDDNQRRRLRHLLQDLQPPPGLGFIIRTAGLDRTKKELLRDLHYLTRLWRVIVKRLRKVKGPDLIYEESDMITRTIRDVFTSEIERIRVDEPKAFEHAQEFLNFVMPRYADRLTLDSGAEPLFHRYGLEKEIAKIQQKRLPLPGGGSLVIEQTEALVAIDVNSGNTRVQDDAEETAFRVNLTAAKEVARQLRLRDLGGVIVIDFIDMREERHRRKVEDALADAIRRDRARTKPLRMSQFGIIQMTRQRIRPSLKRSQFQDCPSCLGTGHVKTAESMSIEVMRLLQLAVHRSSVSRIHLRVAEPVAQYLLNRKRREIAELEGQGNQQVTIFGSLHLPPEALEVTCYDSAGGEVRILPPEPAAGRPPRGRLERGRE